MPSKNANYAALLAGFILATAGCTAAIDPGGAARQSTPSVDQLEGEREVDANTFDSMLSEFRAAAGDLAVPAGVTLEAPIEPKPDKLPDGTYASPVYEVGFGKTYAHGEWFCAWEGEWLASRDVDAARAAAALEQLKSVYDTETFQRHWDANTQSFTRESLQKAELGDPTLVHTDVTLNCE